MPSPWISRAAPGFSTSHCRDRETYTIGSWGGTLQTVHLHRICDSGRQVLDQNIDRITGSNSRHQGGEGSQQKKAWRCYWIIFIYPPIYLPLHIYRGSLLSPKVRRLLLQEKPPPQAPHIPSLHAEVHDVTIQVGKLALEAQEGLPRQRRFRGFGAGGFGGFRGFRV